MENLKPIVSQLSEYHEVEDTYILKFSVDFYRTTQM